MTKTINKLVLILAIGLLFSCIGNDNEDDLKPESNSILGTWKITSLTSNGVEELPELLTFTNTCYWTQIYTETTFSQIIFSGTDCKIETIVENLPYSKKGTTISYTSKIDGKVSLHIKELTNKTLKIKDVYNESGKDFIDIYTFIRVE